MGTAYDNGANASGIFDQARATVRTIVDRQVGSRMSEAATLISNVSKTVVEIGAEVLKRQPSARLANVTSAIVTRLDASAAYLQTTKPGVAYVDLQRVGGERPIAASLVAIAIGYGAARVVRVSLERGTL